MSAKTFFIDNNFIPPGGLFFFEAAGERATGRTFVEIIPKVRAILARHGIKGFAESLLAEYMCPRMPNPGAYCRGELVPAAHVRPHVAIRESLPYCKRQVVAFDVIERRMRKCQECPMHKREWCPTCTGHVSSMMQAFGKRRTALPEDTLSGVCQCARAYELAIASVEYGEKEPVWEGVPDTCWRKTDV